MLNHFAISCNVRDVKNVQVDQGNSDDSDVFVGNCNCDIISCNHVKMWDETILIENKTFKVRLDTGADVSILPKEKFDKINGKFLIQHTRHILKGFEGTQAKTI